MNNDDPYAINTLAAPLAAPDTADGSSSGRRFRWFVIPAALSCFFSVLYAVGLVSIAWQSVFADAGGLKSARFMTLSFAMLIAMVVGCVFNLIAARWWLKRRYVVATVANLTGLFGSQLLITVIAWIMNSEWAVDSYY